MKIKLSLPNISPAKRQQLERTRNWLLELLEAARAKRQELQRLLTTLAEAESRAKASDEKAATDPEAAHQFAAADVQVRKLRPLVAASTKSLGNQLNALGLQIGTVIKHDISENFAIELFKLLFEKLELEKLLKPYLRPDLSLHETAMELYRSSWQNLYLSGFLLQPSPSIANLEDAESAVQEIISKLDALINGKTLLEIPEPPVPTPPAQKKAAATPGPTLTREQVIEQAYRAAAAVAGPAARYKE